MSPDLSKMLRAVQDGFAGFTRPPSYVAADIYEPERQDYESMLEGRPREDLGAAHFGSVSWSPLLSLSREAGGYLLPRLVELAESGARDRDGELFLMRVVNVLAAGPGARVFALFNAAQRKLVLEYLQVQAAERMALFEQECWDFALEEAIKKWGGGDTECSAVCQG